MDTAPPRFHIGNIEASGAGSKDISGVGNKADRL